ncbi:IPT/TIG domain-containing protein [Chryseolinea serpens]|uniref:IPT/TIG domain-containing protein n=1 Tax=Chryseolinea serpens TaxID=947013 RepID=A0A1M5UD10_9BACT|nr:IPT/TIG domain-containing protein [Chryseolinea serpens]SHH60830.1 IPT/TIG domain-containing protein [Chryseolinea serpens]
MDIQKKITRKVLTAMGLLIGAASLFVSCNDDEPGGTPALERVSLVAKDSTTQSGKRGTTYVIYGNNLATTREVYFNESLAPLNVTLVRNDNIIIRIPDNAPFADVPNKIRVVTEFGQAELPFVIQQPGPKITSFDPAFIGAGGIVTIEGEFFENLQSVKFDDAEAEVVSASGKEIEVKVPDGVTSAYLYVTTSAGTVKSTSAFGFKFVIYDEDLVATWQKWGGWSSTTDWTSTQQAKRGDKSMKITYDGAWGGSQSHPSNTFVLVNNYTAVKLSIFGGAGTTGKNVMLFIKDNDGVVGTQKSLAITEGVWTDYTIPLTELGSPSTINEFVFQDQGGAPYVIFIDDIGLL